MRFAILAAAALAIPAAAFAANPLEDTVLARQGYYKLMGANMGVLAAMAKGDVDYDSTSAQAAADNMGTLTTYNLRHLFVPGTTSTDMPGKTRLLQAAFDDMAGVGARGQALGEAVAAMQAVAGTGKAEMAGALGALGGACKGCHDNYRAK